MSSSACAGMGRGRNREKYRSSARFVEFGRADVWYLRYRNRKGQWCKAKATTPQIVQRLRDGKLSRADEACHDAQGDFRSLGDYPEFRAAAARARARGRKHGPAEGPRDRPAALGQSGEGAAAALALPTRWWLRSEELPKNDAGKILKYQLVDEWAARQL